MKYYYLNSEKKPMGPYSWKEIQNLKQAGLVGDDTLAAAAGDNNWSLLSELEKECSTWNNSAIQHSAEVNNKEELSLWGCFVHALRNYAVFRGRASRKEFWGFFLFYFILNQVVQMLVDLMLRNEAVVYQEKIAQISEENYQGLMNALGEYLSQPMVQLGAGISLIYSLFMLTPFLAVSVRRLHDTASSATGVIIGCIADVVMIVSLGVFIYCFIQGPEINSIIVAFWVFLASGLCFLGVSIYLFIKMLQSGDVSENKYGPSPRI